MSYEALMSRGLTPKVPDSLDSSMLKDYADCPSKFYLRHVLGLKKKGIEDSDDLRYGFGTFWHKMLEVYYTTLREKSQAEAMIAALAVLQDWPAILNPATDPKKRSKERTAKMFMEYIEKWEVQDRGIEFLREEQHFDIYMEDGRFRWQGRIDSIRRRKARKVLTVWDYKSATRMGSHYFDGHEVGFQFPGYVKAADAMSTDPVNEITVDVVYVLQASHDFFRRSFRYAPQRLAEWERNVAMYVEEIYGMLEKHLWEPEKWKKNWNECTRYGLCQFFDIHSLAPIGTQRLAILESEYKEDRWDPANPAGAEVDED